MKYTLLLQKIKIKSTFLKLILSFFLIAFVITSTLSATLFYAFQKTALTVIQSDSVGRLSLNINHLELIQSRIFSLGKQMLEDPSINRAVFSYSELAPEDDAILHRKLDNIIYSDSIIHSICLYNAKLNKSIDTFGVDGRDAFLDNMQKLINDYNVYDSFKLVPIKTNFKRGDGELKTEDTITAIFTRSEYFDDNSKVDNSSLPKKSAIIINLDAEVLQQSIASSPKDQQLETIIVDSDGKVVFDSKMQEFAENISYKSYINEILMSSRAEDVSIKKIDGMKSLLVYKKTKPNGWTFINKYTFDSLFKEIYKLRTIMIFICIGILLAALSFSVITANTIYSPFKRLLKSARDISFPNTRGETEAHLEKIGDAEYLTNTFKSMMKRAVELEKSVNESAPLVKKVFLSKLIMGKQGLEPQFSQPLEEMFEKLNENHLEGCFSVIVFNMDDYVSMIKKGNIKNDDIMLSSIEIIITTAVSQYFHCEPIDYENRYIYVLIRIENEKYLTLKSKNSLNKIHKDIEKSLGFKISCAVGMPVNSIRDISLSYSNAIDMIRYRLVKGYGSFFSYDMEELSAKQVCVSIDKRKEKLIQSIKICDISSVENEIDKIINEISICQFDYIMLTLNQLMLDIVKSVQSFFDIDSEELDFNNLYGNLNNIDTLEEIKTFFILYCMAAIDKIEKKKFNMRSEVIMDITKYINENYQSYNISTESLSQMANLTSGYFGKLFNEYTGKSVNEYIVNLRLEKAKELLNSTSSPINDISSKVGFNNSTYFMTVFKKAFGVTPNQYRTESKMSK